MIRQCNCKLLVLPSPPLKGWLPDCWVWQRTCYKGDMLPPSKQQIDNCIIFRKNHQHEKKRTPRGGFDYLRKLLKGTCCFLVLIWRPSNNNNRPMQKRHTLGCAGRHTVNCVKAAWMCWLILYQQFILALAIPPNAWMSPGPDTTRQAPGLQTYNQRREQHIEKETPDAHMNQQILPSCQISNSWCCITCLFRDRIYWIWKYQRPF